MGNYVFSYQSLLLTTTVLNDYVHRVLGLMASLQQQITRNVLTSLAGIQPIMNKLLTEISSSSSDAQ